jgi:hypothetical protein
MNTLHKELIKGNVLPQHALVIPLPDPTHTMKNIKQAVSNYSVVWKGQDMDVRLMGTAVFDDPAFHKTLMIKEKILRQTLTGGDRQSITAIMQVARLASAVERAKWVITTPIPELLRPWEDNTVADIGTLYDAAFYQRKLYFLMDNKLMRGDLHSPTRLTVVASLSGKPSAIAIAANLVFVACDSGLAYGELRPGASSATVSHLKGKALTQRCREAGLDDNELQTLLVDGKRWKLLNRWEGTDSPILPFMMSEPTLRKELRLRQQSIPAGRFAMEEALNASMQLSQAQIDDARQRLGVPAAREGSFLHQITLPFLVGFKPLAVAAIALVTSPDCSCCVVTKTPKHRMFLCLN